MTLPQTIIDAADRFGDRCTEQLQTAPKAEWAMLDPRWLVQHLRTHTAFDADAVGEMIAYAQAAARRAASTAAPSSAVQED